MFFFLILQYLDSAAAAVDERGHQQHRLRPDHLQNKQKGLVSLHQNV